MGRKFCMPGRNVHQITFQLGENMLKKILSHLREPSTWAGLSGLFMLAGLNIEQAQAVAHAGAAIAAGVAVFLPEGGRGA